MADETRSATPTSGPSSPAAAARVREPTEEEIRDEMKRISPDGRPPRARTQRWGWLFFVAVLAASVAALFVWAKAFGGSVWIGVVAVLLVVLGGLLRAAPALLAGAFRRGDRRRAEENVRRRALLGEEPRARGLPSDAAPA